MAIKKSFQAKKVFFLSFCVFKKWSSTVSMVFNCLDALDLLREDSSPFTTVLGTHLINLGMMTG